MTGNEKKTRSYNVFGFVKPLLFLLSRQLINGRDFIFAKINFATNVLDLLTTDFFSASLLLFRLSAPSKLFRKLLTDENEFF